MRMTPSQVGGVIRLRGKKYGVLGLLPRALRTVAGALTLLSPEEKIISGAASLSAAQVACLPGIPR